MTLLQDFLFGLLGLAVIIGIVVVLGLWWNHTGKDIYDDFKK